LAADVGVDEGVDGELVLAAGAGTGADFSFVSRLGAVVSPAGAGDLASPSAPAVDGVDFAPRLSFL
jgi:hypothetical protein